MKKKLGCFVLSVLMAMLLLLSACGKDAPEEKPFPLLDYSINDISYTLERGDQLHTGAWNGQETRVNDVLFVGFPVLYQGITVGADYHEVLEVFDIRKGYAYADIEIRREGEDGMSDLVTQAYESEAVFDEDYLSLCISFGYIKEADQWRLIHIDELEDSLNGEVLIFSIEFNGMSEQAVEIGEVIAFSVVYQ